MDRDDSSLGHLAPNAARAWEFDDEVTGVFEDMLRRSIPQYDVMREAVLEVGSKIIDRRIEMRGPQANVVDLGCARGDGLAAFVNKWGAYANYLGVDASDPMVEAARAAFQKWDYSRLVQIAKMDLRTDFPMVRDVDVVLLVLTLQFVPIEYRQKVVSNCYDALAPRGCLILVEKVLGNSAATDAAFVDIYLKLKQEHGYSEEEIQRKKLALEGVLVPMRARWNEELLSSAGFSEVDCFWRWMNFGAWVAIKRDK